MMAHKFSHVVPASGDPSPCLDGLAATLRATARLAMTARPRGDDGVGTLPMLNFYGKPSPPAS